MTIKNYDNLPSILEVTQFLESPQLTLLAGGESHGKSALALQLGCNAAKQNKSVLFFSLQHESNTVKERIQQYTDYSFESTPIFIEDMYKLTINDIGLLSRRHKRIHRKLDLIIVDGLQYINVDGKPCSIFTHEYKVILHELREICKELNCSVLITSDVTSKANAYKEGDRIDLTNLPNSIPDIIISITRCFPNKSRLNPSEHTTDSYNKWAHKGQFEILKNKVPWVVKPIACEWNPTTLRFIELPQ